MWLIYAICFFQFQYIQLCKWSQLSIFLILFMKDKFRKRGSSQIFVCPIASQFTYAGSKFNVTKKKIHLILSILYSLAI